MMGEPSVAKESRQHGKRARREGLVDEWFLPVESLDRRATGQRLSITRPAQSLLDEALAVVVGDVPESH